MLGPLLRPKVDPIRAKVFEKVAKYLPRPGILTVLSFYFAILFIPTFGTWLGLVFLLLAYTMDLVDGAVARAKEQATKWGNYFDAMVDKFVDATVLLAHALAGYSVPAAFALAGSLMESYAKPRLALVIPIDNRDWPAIGERPDRALIIVIGYLCHLLWGLDPSIYLWVLAAVTWYGTLSRMRYAKRLIEERSRG